MLPWIFLLVALMGGLVYAAVELWHLLHFNEGVKASHTKTLLCYVGFGLSIVLATACMVGVGYLIHQYRLLHPHLETSSQTLDYMKGTLSMFPTDRPLTAEEAAERAALLEEIDDVEKQLAEEQSNILLMKDRIAQLEQQMNAMSTFAKDRSAVIQSQAYQDLLKEKNMYEAEVNQLQLRAGAIEHV